MKYLVFWGALFLFSIPLSAQITTTSHHTIYFDFDRHELSVQGEESLDRLAGQLLAAADYAVVLEAHTDDRGAEVYNSDLGRRRAETVQGYLAAQGVEVAKTTVTSFGEERPVYANDDDAGRQLNRRVDLHVTTWTYGSVDDLLGQLGEGEAHQFTVDPRRNTRLVGQGGTTVVIPAGSLVFADGTVPAGPVSITLQEAYGFGDMIGRGLHTMAGHQLLETGGMIYLQASVGGRPLQVADDRSLILGMPAEELQEGMELFQGTTDAAGRLTDWQATGQSFSADLEAAILRMPERPEPPIFTFLPPAFHLNRSGEPLPPSRPRAPTRPHEPRRESFRYHPGFFKTLAMGKKRIEQREEAQYQEALVDYGRKMERYDRRLVVYQQQLQDYGRQLLAYREAHAAWTADLQQQRENWRQSPAYQAAFDRGVEEHEARMLAWQQAQERWEALRIERLEAFEANYDEVGSLDAASLSNYVYQVNTLGWINCDRFLDVPQEAKAQLVIADGDEAGERIFVVFEELKSLVSASKEDRQYVTGALPKAATVKIVGVKVENGRARMAVKQVSVGNMEGSRVSLDYRPCRLGDIRKTLAAL